MGRLLPVLVLPGVAGHATLFPHEGEELGNGDRGGEISPYLGKDIGRCRGLEGTLQLVLVLDDPGLNFGLLLVILLDGDHSVLGEEPPHLLKKINLSEVLPPRPGEENLGTLHQHGV